MPIPSPEGITGCWNADGALYGVSVPSRLRPSRLAGERGIG
jgi:hypothetical protein